MAVKKKNQIKSTLFDNKIWLKSVEQRKQLCRNDGHADL